VRSTRCNWSGASKWDAFAARASGDTLRWLGRPAGATPTRPLHLQRAERRPIASIDWQAGRPASAEESESESEPAAHRSAARRRQLAGRPFIGGERGQPGAYISITSTWPLASLMLIDAARKQFKLGGLLPAWRSYRRGQSDRSRSAAGAQSERASERAGAGRPIGGH